MGSQVSCFRNASNAQEITARTRNGFRPTNTLLLLDDVSSLETCRNFPGDAQIECIKHLVKGGATNAEIMEMLSDFDPFVVKTILESLRSRTLDLKTRELIDKLISKEVAEDEIVEILSKQPSQLIRDYIKHKRSSTFDDKTKKKVQTLFSAGVSKEGIQEMLSMVSKTEISNYIQELEKLKVVLEKAKKLFQTGNLTQEEILDVLGDNSNRQEILNYLKQLKGATDSVLQSQTFGTKLKDSPSTSNNKKTSNNLTEAELETLQQLINAQWTKKEIIDAFPEYQNVDIDGFMESKTKLSDQDKSTIQRMVATGIDDSAIVRKFSTKASEKEINALIGTRKELNKKPPYEESQILQIPNQRQDEKTSDFTAIKKMFESGMEEADIIKIMTHIPKQETQKILEKLKAPSDRVPVPEAKLLETANGLEMYFLPSKTRFSSSYNKKTFIVLGETGSGKTTLIDAIGNHLMGVEFNDTFRYKVVDESKIKAQKQTGDSQTDDVTFYNIEGPSLDWRITIVDTPGFGDTRGIDQDIKTTEKIEKIFKSDLDSLDYVLFVVKASETRFTDRARWIYFKIQDIFGKDMEHRILIMATFCDGGTPNCIETLKAEKIPFAKIYQFNNSGIFTSGINNSRKKEENLRTKGFWNLGIQSFKVFFDDIQGSRPISLNQTRDVIRIKEDLEMNICNTYEKIEYCNIQFDSMKRTMQEIATYKDVALGSKDFEIWIDEPKFEKIDISGRGQHTTNCLNCNMTCHPKCIYADDNDKAKCVAMGPNGQCKECPGKCHWGSHKNLPYIVKVKTVKSKKTLESLKTQYCAARSSMSAKDQILSGIKEELKNLAQEILGYMEKVKSCYIQLEKIALKPNPFEAITFVENMIQSELIQKKPGWECRTSQLQKMKDKMEKAKKINKDCNFEDFYPQYEAEIEELYQEMKKQKQSQLVNSQQRCIIF